MVNNKSVRKLKTVSRSQGNYKKTVAENKQQFYQDLIDERFEYATDYMQIQEETAVGSNEYQKIGVRVTHGLNSGASNTFAKEFKKIIFQHYNHEQYLGKKYKFKGKTWLTTDMNEITNISSHSFVRQCNNILKWYNPNNKLELFTEECVFTNQFTNTSFKDGTENVIQISGDFQILCQLNERTKTIAYNQRFVLNGLSFQVTQFDNHRSDTYLIMKVKQIDIQANDNVVDNIANDTQGVISTNTEIKILPQIIKILQGESQEFSVEKYVDGIIEEDIFTMTVSQTPEENYTFEVIDDNHFKITNIQRSPIPLIVKCMGEKGGETEMTIILGGTY